MYSSSREDISISSKNNNHLALSQHDTALKTSIVYIIRMSLVRVPTVLIRSAATDMATHGISTSRLLLLHWI